MRFRALCIVVFLAGCGIFGGGKKNEYFSLDTIPGPGPRAARGGVPIGIDGIELPPGFDRRDIVVRGADHRINVRGNQLWAGPLEDMVVHTLAFNLANRLPEGMVVLPGQAKPPAMRSVYLVMEDLAPGPDNVFVLDARWTLTTTGQPQLTRHERITVPMSSSASAQIAAAMSSALATLADRIAAAI